MCVYRSSLSLLLDRAEGALNFAVVALRDRSVLQREVLLAFAHIFSTCRCIGEIIAIQKPTRQMKLIVELIPAMIYFLINRLGCYLEVLNLKHIPFSRTSYRWMIVALIEVTKLLATGIHNRAFLISLFGEYFDMLRKVFVYSRSQISQHSPLHDCSLSSPSKGPVGLQRTKKHYIAPCVNYSRYGTRENECKSLTTEESHIAGVMLLLVCRPIAFAFFTLSLEIWRSSGAYACFFNFVQDNLTALTYGNTAHCMLFSTLARIDCQLSWLPWLARVVYDCIILKSGTRMISFFQNNMLLPGARLMEQNETDSPVSSDPHARMARTLKVPSIRHFRAREEYRDFFRQLSRNIMSALLVEPFYSSCRIDKVIYRLFIHGGATHIPFLGPIVRDIAVHFQRMHDSSWIFSL